MSFRNLEVPYFSQGMSLQNENELEDKIFDETIDPIVDPIYDIICKSSIKGIMSNVKQLSRWSSDCNRK